MLTNFTRSLAARSRRLSRQWLTVLLASVLALLFYGVVAPVLSRAESSQAKVFEQIWQTVNDNFYDPKFNGVNWQAMRQKYAPQATQARSPEALAVVVNQMLEELNVSHTRYYTSAEPEYYQLAGIFWQRGIQRQLKPFLPNGKLEYVGIGAYTRDVDGKTFIRAVLDGSPAARAGLKVGDQLLSVEGKPFQPIQSFAENADRPVKIQIQRTPDAAAQTIAVTPKRLDPTTMFLEAMKSSVEVIERGDKKIGYIHIWSYADDVYQRQLEQELSDRLSQVDGLVWDLRDGWGGAEPSYLNPFTAPALNITFTNRNGTKGRFDLPWRKPVVMLVNQGSRSGKEILAYGFRQFRVGKIVGSKTAGALLAGRAYIMQDGSLLYLAVADVSVNGERLEGKGVVPDIDVPFTVPYAQGSDPQKDRAIAAVLEAIASPVRNES
ncbi:Carboxyl-terminal protease [uncultured Leptolyngbya sp.]|uniref:Carboxyl-terminal protease n=1 Tax=uncultured Leptolyngbya sp. TaxID=332963 RepID=A0A6J4PW97_9CYAN|nr:Carboxyl-terminal protease [uncultured Leptolyngbya sp.]